MADVSVVGGPVLRQRLCGNPECRALFNLCVTCDRGQRYCSPACRSLVRRQQRQKANRRYQQGASGKEAHRRCQQRYRGGPSKAAVTDQGTQTITSPPSTPPKGSLPMCRLRSPKFLVRPLPDHSPAIPAGAASKKLRFLMIANTSVNLKQGMPQQRRRLGRYFGSGSRSRTAAHCPAAALRHYGSINGKRERERFGGIPSCRPQSSNPLVLGCFTGSVGSLYPLRTSHSRCSRGSREYGITSG